MAGPAFTRGERALIGGAAAIVFTRVFAFSVVLPGLATHARGLLPAGLTPRVADLLVGIAFGAYGLTMALAQLGNGILSDRIGRRPILMGGSLLFVLGSLGAAYAAGIWTLIAARLVQGLGGVSSTAMAAVGETVPPSRRTAAMALVGIPAGLGFFLGILCWPFLEPHVGIAGLFLLSALLGGLSAVPFLLAGTPPSRAGPSLASPSAASPGLGRETGGSSAAQPRFPAAALAAAGFALNFSLMVTLFGLDALLLATGTWAFGAMLAIALVAMGIATRSIDRAGWTWPPIAFGLVLLAVAAPAFRLLAPVPAILLAGSLFFAAHAILSAVLPSQVSRVAGRQGGRGHGIQLVSAYLGTFAGGAIAGLSTAWPPAAFLALAGLCLAAIVAVATQLGPARIPGETR